MKDKINVAELLKDCPKGMELDCYLFDRLEFDRIDTDNENYPIVCRVKTVNGEYNKHTFTKYGWYSAFFDYSKCVIFPKGKTTWEGFTPPCQFKDGDIIYIRDEYSDATFTYVAIIRHVKDGQVYSHCFYNYEDTEFSTDDYLYDVYRMRFATEEEKQKLFQAIKEHGYRWDSENKTLKKLPKFKVGDVIIPKDFKNKSRVINVILDNEYNLFGGGKIPFSDQDKYELAPNKFDINTLKPFDKVLVRNTNVDYWKINMFGYISKGDNQYFMCVANSGFYQCIPYEGNEHLLGTTDDCNEYFKTWK